MKYQFRDQFKLNVDLEQTCCSTCCLISAIIRLFVCHPSVITLHSLASLQSLSPTPLQDNPRELTPMPSSPFSFESNTPEKSISPVPSPAGFKIMSSMHALQTTSKKTKMEQQNTLSSFCDSQENAQNDLFTDISLDVSPTKMKMKKLPVQKKIHLQYR